MGKSRYDQILSMPALISKAITDVSDFLKDPKLCIENRRQIRQIFRSYGASSKSFEKALLYYAISSPRAARKIAENYCKCTLTLLKEGKWNFDTEDDPIFLCVVKDDLKRIQMSYTHHKRIGIRKFIYIDNGSSDGTLEWLMEQDVTVFQTQDPFIMWSKVAWISHVIEQIGFDRWYLIVDSDELFVYPGYEEHPIGEYISSLKEHSTERCLSFMLDMYTDRPLFEKHAGEIMDRFCYFDADSYSMSNCLHYTKIMGGPRQRVFADKDSMDMLQNKYPLVYMRRGDVYRYHYVCPYRKNFKTTCTSALLHYKFLDGDLEKYQKIAADGNYANGSRLYKDIVKKVENEGSICFYNENSVKYHSSMDLLKHQLIHNWK